MIIVSRSQDPPGVGGSDLQLTMINRRWCSAQPTGAGLRTAASRPSASAAASSPAP